MQELQIPIDLLRLHPAGSHADGPPESVLTGTVQIGSGSFHVAAYEVVKDADGVLHATNSAYAGDLDRVYDLNGDSLSSIEINGLQYVLVIYPFAR